MSDIVERLRKKDTRKGPSDWIDPDQICIEAADEIEKLRKSLQDIKRVARSKSTHAWDSHAEYWRMAKAGLGEDQ